MDTNNTPNEITKSERVRRRRWPWVLLGIFLLIVGLRFSLRAGFVLDLVRSQVVSLAADQLNGDLEIDRFEGDLWQELTLTGLRVRQSDGTLAARIDSVRLRYSLWTLFGKALRIDEISVFSPEVFATQTSDSTWNLLELFPVTETDTVGSSGEIFPVELPLIQIYAGRVQVYAPGILPDSAISIQDIILDTGISLREDGVRMQLRTLSMDIHEGRLGNPLRLGASATVDPQRITLEKLTLATAATFLEATARVAADGSELSAEALLRPLDWRDILAYSSEPLLVQNLDIDVHLEGDFEVATLQVLLAGDGLENLRLGATFSIAREFEITAFEVTSGRINLPRITAQPEWPVIGGIEGKFEGRISIAHLEDSHLTGGLTVRQISLPPYRVDRMELRTALDAGSLTGSLTADRLRERVQAEFRVGDVFATAPDWDALVRSRSFNPALWLADAALEARLDVVMSASGQGFLPSETPWHVSLTAGGRWNEQPFKKLTSDVTVTSAEIKINAGFILRESNITLQAQAQEWSGETMRYTFEVQSDALDLSALSGLENFPTRIESTLRGSGSGTDPDRIRLAATLNLRNSIINGAGIDTLHSRIRLDRNILTVDETYLRSTLAEGDLDLRQNLSALDDPENRLLFRLALGNIQPLAPLADLGFLQAKGDISGRLRTTTRGFPEVQLQLALRDLVLDTLFVGRLDAAARIDLYETPIISADVRIGEVSTTQTLLNDLWLVTETSYTDTLLTGTYRLETTFFDEFTLNSQGDYHYTETFAKLHTHTLNLREGNNRYVLENPFSVHYNDALLRLEPIQLAGRSGVSFFAEAEQYTQSAWRGQFHTTEADLAVFQRMLNDQMPVTGRLNARAQFDVDMASMKMNVTSDLNINGFSVNHFGLDTLRFALEIDQNRLTAVLDTWRGGETFLQIHADIPYAAGDPSDFDNSFFEQPVSGTFRMPPLLLESEPSFLRALNLEGLQGRIQLTGDLSGTAGLPEVDIRMDMMRARFSGVAVDSLGFALRFDQREEAITLHSELISGGQQALSLRGTMPLSVNWRTFEMEMASEANPNDIRLNTNAFNLASFNQFTDRSVVRNIAGRLSADIRLRGDFEQPQLTGMLSLQQGGIHVVETNSTFSNARMDLRFSRDRIQLERFNVQSLGEFSGEGEIRLDGFVPSEVDLALRASGFRVIDTRDFQAFISMDTQIGGSFEAPKMTGTLGMDRGYVYLDNFGEREVEMVILEEDGSSMAATMDFWENLAMELQISTERSFYVRNRARPEINLQLRGELDLVKYAGEDVQVFGTMGASDGYVTQLGKRFVLERGDLTFSGPPMNPELNIRTLYALRQPSDIRIWYNIRGTAEEPQFVYESDPEMELPDMVSYTLFGRPVNALMSWEQGVAGRSDGSISDVAFDVLLDRVEQLATERLGIDVLQIDNTRSSGSSGTTIKAGKYLSDRLFIAILQELGSNVSSQVMLEYAIRRNLDVVVTGSDNYQTGIDIMWRRDY